MASNGKHGYVNLRQSFLTTVKIMQEKPVPFALNNITILILPETVAQLEYTINIQTTVIIRHHNRH